MRPTPDYPLDYTKGPAPTGSPEAAQIAAKSEDFVSQAKEYAAQAQQAVQNFKPFLEKSAREQPMTTLAALAAVGFVLGSLWKK